MQISAQQVQRVLEKVTTGPHAHRDEPAVHGVEELAEKYGVRADDVERFAPRAESADNPFREERVSDLARRVQQGAYEVPPEQVVDMAERRAIADRSGQI